MKDEVSTMLITVLFINRYENFPSTITLSEDQKLEYEDNKYFVSMYDVTESSIFYKFSRILYIFHEVDPSMTTERKRAYPQSSSERPITPPTWPINTSSMASTTNHKLSSPLLRGSSRSLIGAISPSHSSTKSKTQAHP